MLSVGAPWGGWLWQPPPPLVPPFPQHDSPTTPLGHLRPVASLVYRLTVQTHSHARQRRTAHLSTSCACSLEKALRRFRKATNMCGHLRILRNRKTFESSHDKMIRKTKEQSMRLARARRSARARNNF
eukprot:CAMPEP_0181208994 /NCGR_PEP_ID=MMETSP1096-20121128/22419_1 /TAXON_ID=156174 ORGANISM="Chrysochromulina ericina, Strain CCMP281" /NCGR_SAMPLE_ID=MMETSP1096 /ASSEMBLY_ACC=CAM_ASM_000453 /LENGTH=127 /DNA_ID=CAMNT_0023300105 /DNA_START=115 /DNA_END=498 /DNA_ORIENTATION=+